MKLLEAFKDKATYLLTAVMAYYNLFLGGIWQSVPIVHNFIRRTPTSEKVLVYTITVLVTVAVVYPLALLAVATVRALQDKSK